MGNTSKSLRFLIILLSLSSPAAAQLQEGFIIENDDGRFPGLIKLHSEPGHEYIVYKENKKTPREILTPEDIQAFVVGVDSFISVKAYPIPLTKTIHNGFAKAILRAKGQAIAKFEIKHTAGTGANSRGVQTHYVIFRKKEIITLTDLNFYDEVPAVIAGHPELQQKVLSKQLTFANLEQLAIEYEQWRVSQK